MLYQKKRHIAIFLWVFIFLSGIFQVNVYANQDIEVGYRLFFAGSKGWSTEMSGGNRLYETGEYPSALWIAIKSQPEGMSGTLNYQVNLSGYGWLNPVENATETGAADLGREPLEAVKVWLTGDLALHYDVYVKVLQDGAWSDWVNNGEVAGTEGVGKHIDGINLVVVKKGEPIPEEKTAYSHIDTSKPMIALTFDDGPRAGRTMRIVESLKANDARATFFVVGKSIQGNESILKSIAGNGNEIGNHTYAHAYITKQSEAGRREAIVSVNTMVENITGSKPSTFRPPGGYIDAVSQETLRGMGLPVIMWSIDTLDWKTRNTNATIQAVLSQVKDGDIILMHDIHEPTVEAALVLIPELKKRGYQLVTVSEMAALRGGMEAGHKYYKFR